MMVRTGAYVILICLGSNLVPADQVRAGSLLSNLFAENRISRPPKSIPNLAPSARVPLPHARPDGGSSAAVGTKPGPQQDSQRVPPVISPSATTNNNNAAPAEPAAVTFPPVAPLE
jgi:hypothetical protein